MNRAATPVSRARPSSVKPWWKQLWPWMLIALPASMVVIGFTLLGVAFHGSDSLVTAHPYDKGLAVGGVIVKAQRAEQLHLSAGLQYAAGMVTLTLRPALDTADTLRLKLQNPHGAAGDQDLILERIAPGVYRAPAQLQPVQYAAVLDGPDWALAGRWEPGQTGTALWPGVNQGSGDAPQDD